MTRSRGPGVPQALPLVITVLLALTALIAGPAPSRDRDAAAQQATPTLNQTDSDPPLQTSATGDAVIPGEGAPLIGITLDPELAIGWERHGCHLNPGNPSCLTIGLAAACAVDAASAGCATDSDGDGCTDVAEVRAGFDAFEIEDCIGSAAGEPVVNCLFLFEPRACDGSSDAGRDGSDGSGCVGAAQMTATPCDMAVISAQQPGAAGVSGTDTAATMHRFRPPLQPPYTPAPPALRECCERREGTTGGNSAHD